MLSSVVAARPVPLVVGLPDGDVTSAALEHPVGRGVERFAGDAASALAIAGASTLVANHQLAHTPMLEHVGARIVLASMVAAGVDTAVQARNLVAGDEQRRGVEESTPGTLAYAATGLIPGASVGALAGLHRHPARAEVLGLGLLAVNGAMLGYELFTRVPKIIDGTEDASGYGSLLASLGGFVVVHRFVAR